MSLTIATNPIALRFPDFGGGKSVAELDIIANFVYDNFPEAVRRCPIEVCKDLMTSDDASRRRGALAKVREHFRAMSPQILRDLEQARQLALQSPLLAGSPAMLAILRKNNVAADLPHPKNGRLLTAIRKLQIMELETALWKHFHDARRLAAQALNPVANFMATPESAQRPYGRVRRGALASAR